MEGVNGGLECLGERGEVDVEDRRTQGDGADAVLLAREGDGAGGAGETCGAAVGHKPVFLHLIIYRREAECNRWERSGQMDGTGGSDRAVRTLRLVRDLILGIDGDAFVSFEGFFEGFRCPEKNEAVRKNGKIEKWL